ncbi:hypothetical protein [Brevundimonas sp.]|uniref:hypothetical protein n=1 Tax=Brevundimonas sp. TaxID=1871086 RepID=UPI0035AFDAC8
MEPETTLGLIQAVFAIPALVFLAIAFWWPAQLTWAQNRERHLRYQGPRFWFIVIVLGIGLSIIGYHGLGAVLSWIPDGWGFHDEDGEWTNLEPFLRGIGGLIFACGIAAISEARAEAASHDALNRRVLLALSRALEKPRRDVGEEAYRARLIWEARAALGRTKTVGLESIHRETLLMWFAEADPNPPNGSR